MYKDRPLLWVRREERSTHFSRDFPAQGRTVHMFLLQNSWRSCSERKGRLEDIDGRKDNLVYYNSIVSTPPSAYCHDHTVNTERGNSLAVQWLGFCASTAQSRDQCVSLVFKIISAGKHSLTIKTKWWLSQFDSNKPSVQGQGIAIVWSIVRRVLTTGLPGKCCWVLCVNLLPSGSHTHSSNKTAFADPYTLPKFRGQFLVFLLHLTDSMLHSCLEFR